jgi:tetratricopeptide (TPR) repeat protein
MNATTGNGVAIMANSDHGVAAAVWVLRSVAKEYGWNYNPGTQMFSTLTLLAIAKGTPAALQRYTELRREGGKNADLDEQTLNQLGYSLLYDYGRTQDAIAVFQRNVQEYPQSSNVYDSLGEAYMATGQKELAVADYEKSLQLNPKNQNAVDRLKKLKETR